MLEGSTQPPPPTTTAAMKCQSSPSILSCAIPLFGAVAGIATIVTVYLVTELPPGVHTPPISLLGCRPPEHAVYQVGFSITGLLLGYCVLVLFRTFFYDTIRNSYSKWLARSSYVGGILAVVGVMGQGLITLHADFLQNIKAGGVGMTPQDIVHQQLALVFFVGAALHTYTTCWYAYRGDGKAGDNIVTNGYAAWIRNKETPLFSTTSRRVKTVCVVVSFLAAPIAEMYHPTRTIPDYHDLSASPYISDNKRMVNVVGLTQYLAVGAYIVFFGSYSIDLYQLRQLRKTQQKED